MLTVDNNSTDYTCLDHPNAVIIPITDGTHQCSWCLANDVHRDLQLSPDRRTT